MQRNFRIDRSSKIIVHILRIIKYTAMSLSVSVVHQAYFDRRHVDFTDADRTIPIEKSQKALGVKTAQRRYN